ncbi:hypothetical protein EYR41_004888 [Orbilia oligospora]|uniref:Uncharacterized protein n=1 Tax=Orbilia oligospora TaxID=2813651 RepID=A0A7C8PBV8_ORBOL|nr:hypothetical protein TWF751_010788 [Orbilia oligospora]TGJ68803.1 hypothetical protein EYR41_004888 [Orbilia oligospora]
MTWSVTKLSVKANTSDGVADRLYANGNMQVPVDVVITAVNADEKPYYLSDSELATIKLVDYNNVDSQLSGKWKYTHQENEYGHIMDGAGGFVSSSGASGASTHASGHSSVQTKRYWVSTTAIENQKIGAAITEPNGNYYNTHSKDENNFVILTGISPITYNTSNVRVTRDENDTTTGMYTLSYDMQVLYAKVSPTVGTTWKAQNYQLSLKQGLIKKAEIYGYHSSADSLNHSIKYSPSSGGELSIFYMWPLGSQEDRKVGLDVSKNVSPQIPRFDLSATVTVPTNNRRGSVCFTRVHYSAINGFPVPFSWWGSESTEKAGCKIYDEWGNWGQFKIGFGGSSNDQHVVITDTN